MYELKEHVLMWTFECILGLTWSMFYLTCKSFLNAIHVTDMEMSFLHWRRKLLLMFPYGNVKMYFGFLHLNISELTDLLLYILVSCVLPKKFTTLFRVNLVICCYNFSPSFLKDWMCWLSVTPKTILITFGVNQWWADWIFRRLLAVWLG